jgi:hypothetical protein
MRSPRLATPLAALLLAAGASGACASGGDGGSGGAPYGGVVEERPPPPEPLKGRLSVPTPSVVAPPSREFSEEERRILDPAWAAFRSRDAGWPRWRERWHALGAEARGLLADNLYRAMVAARARGALHLVEEARKELVLLGADAVPVLVGGLAVRAVRTPDGDELRVGQEILRDAAEALSIIGAPAVPGLRDIATSGERALAREAIWALGNIGDPSALDDLLLLTGDADDAVRSTAVLALRRYADTRAAGRLLGALDDPEVLVVEKAGEALASRRLDDAVPGLVDALEQGVRDGRNAKVRVAAWCLRKLTGQDHGADAAAWRRWLGSR